MAVATAPKKIILPDLHPGQVDIENSPARFKVVVCGRRWGKTTYGVWKLVKESLEKPGIYWWVAPTFKVVNNSNAWPLLKNLTRNIPGVEVREGDMCVKFREAEIWIKSADNPDGLRGAGLRGMVLDEFPLLKSEAWTDSLRPTLTDFKGWAIFLGTPKGFNWAYRLFKFAEIMDGWEAWQKPTVTNPFIDPAELESARQSSFMTDSQFRQEYEADFGASQYLVYPEVTPESHEWRGATPEFISYHGGIDFGGDAISNHKSSTVIAGLTANDELIIFAAFEEAGPNIAERQLNWTFEQHMKINDARKLSGYRWINEPTYKADKTQMVGIQFMRNMGLNVNPTKGGRDSVTEGIEVVHRRLNVRQLGTPEKETGQTAKPRLFWLPGVPYVAEALMRYRYPEPDGDETHQTSKNPLKVNDDTVDAIRYLVEGVDRGIIGDPQLLYQAEIPRMLE